MFEDLQEVSEALVGFWYAGANDGQWGHKMATHSSILAWKIPWAEEPGRLQSLALQRVGQAWVTNTHTRAQKNLESRTEATASKNTTDKAGKKVDSMKVGRDATHGEKKDERPQKE